MLLPLLKTKFFLQPAFLVCCILVTAVLLPSCSYAEESKPVSKTDSPKGYVGTYEADHEFSKITPDCLKLLKTKKILLGSRSFGLYIMRGVEAYGITTYQYRPVSNIPFPADIFTKPQYVIYMCDLLPKTSRINELNSFFRGLPYKSTWSGNSYTYNLKNKVDVVFLEVGSDNNTGADGYEAVFNLYADTYDALIRDFPGTVFVFLTHHVSLDIEFNMAAKKYNELFWKRYGDQVLVFDFADLLCKDFNGRECTFVKNNVIYRQMCPEFNVGDGIHPNTSEIKDRLGRAFLLMLAKIYCPQCF